MYLPPVPALLLVLLLALLAPARIVAQGLPAFAPINPVAAGRTPLSYEPFRPYRPGRWGLTAGLSYASTIETNNIPTATYLLDSELLRVRFGVSRDLSPRTFVLADAELLGAYSGFLDGFLDWYHGLLGIDIPERDRRPIVGSGPGVAALARGEHDQPGRSRQLAEAVDQVCPFALVRGTVGRFEPEDRLAVDHRPVGHQVEDVELLAELIDHPREGRGTGDLDDRDLLAQCRLGALPLGLDIHRGQLIFAEVNGIGDHDQGP